MGWGAGNPPGGPIAIAAPAHRSVCQKTGEFVPGTSTLIADLEAAERRASQGLGTSANRIELARAAAIRAINDLFDAAAEAEANAATARGGCRIVVERNAALRDQVAELEATIQGLGEQLTDAEREGERRGDVITELRRRDDSATRTIERLQREAGKR